MVKVYEVSGKYIMLFMHNNRYLPLTGLLTLLQWTIQPAPRRPSWNVWNISEIFHEIFGAKKSWNFTSLARGCPRPAEKGGGNVRMGNCPAGELSCGSVQWEMYYTRKCRTWHCRATDQTMTDLSTVADDLRRPWGTLTHAVRKECVGV